MADQVPLRDVARPPAIEKARLAARKAVGEAYQVAIEKAQADFARSVQSAVDALYNALADIDREADELSASPSSTEETTP